MKRIDWKLAACVCGMLAPLILSLVAIVVGFTGAGPAWLALVGGIVGSAYLVSWGMLLGDA